MRTVSLNTLKKAILTIMVLCVGGLGMNCESQKTTTKTEVNDRLLGGKEVKKTEVTEQGDKTQVKETKTKTNSDGTLDEKETTIKGDKIN
jgi:hypothetical protein